MDRELDRDDRDHGVRELDALRLQDGYLLCVMDCFVVVVGLCVCRVCRVGQSVSSQGVSSQVVSMCVRDGDGEHSLTDQWLVQRRRIYRLALPKSGLYAHTMP